MASRGVNHIAVIARHVCDACKPERCNALAAMGISVLKAALGPLLGPEIHVAS